MQTVSSMHNAGASSVHGTGVSWGAIFAGTAASAAMTLVLLILGFGLGLSVISPWADDGVSITTIGISTIAWLTLTQIIASGLGGYLSGRLRVKWSNLHTDEVYFRDTAHGLVTWSVATLIAMVIVTSSIGLVLSAGANATSKITGGVAESIASGVGEMDGNTGEYLIDTLLRSDNRDTDMDEASIRRELTTLLYRDLMDSDLSNVDTQYAAQLVSDYTGVSQREAEVRITEVIERARQAAAEIEVTTLEAVEATREAAAYTALWLFVALLCGAFTAGLLAVAGGRQRDDNTMILRNENHATDIRN